MLPFYFLFGNHDADMAQLLLGAAKRHGSTCLKWGGEIEFAGKRIAVAHGHFPKDFRPLLEKNPDYFLFGHSHETHDSTEGDLRRINPGALHRATEFTVALLDVVSGELDFIAIQRSIRP